MGWKPAVIQEILIVRQQYTVVSRKASSLMMSADVRVPIY